MVTGITQAEMNEEFSNRDFTLDNFILFVQEIDPSLIQSQVSSIFNSLQARSIESFTDAFSVLDSDPDGIVTAEEIQEHCATCQARMAADGVNADIYDDQMEQTRSGDMMQDDTKNLIIDSYLEGAGEGGGVFAPLNQNDRAYLNEIMIYSGEGGSIDAATEAYRLIVDMYVRDADFRDLIQYYIDEMGSPHITMGELEAAKQGSTLFGLGNIGGTDSLIDVTNIMSNDPTDKLRAQETIAHELMHNLGLDHEEGEEETAFDLELGTMFDMEDSDPPTNINHPWHGYAAANLERNPVSTMPSSGAVMRQSSVLLPSDPPVTPPTTSESPAVPPASPSPESTTVFGTDPVFGSMGLDFSWVYGGGSPP